MSEFDKWFYAHAMRPVDSKNAWYLAPEIEVVHHVFHEIKDLPHDTKQKQKCVWYVSRCFQAGFVTTPAIAIQCVERWLLGKRKVSPPFTKQRKRAAQALRKAISNISQELRDAVTKAKELPAYAQYLAGNEKSLNAAVGFVLKTVKTEPSLVRQLLIKTTN